jgi:SAM-dependent methyltransferase
VQQNTFGDCRRGRVLTGRVDHGGVMSYELPFSPRAKIIELGGGENPSYRPNVDVRAGSIVDFVADFDKPLPIATNEWDAVYCRFAIEHISWRMVSGFVDELARILRSPGCAVVITANAEAQMRWALSRPDWDEKVSQCLAGDQDFSENTHKVFFNPSWIARLFRRAGFQKTIILPYGELKTDMIVEAYK